jgi:hypothetical protein
MPTRGNIGYYPDEIPKDVRVPAMAKVLTFGAYEIANLLSTILAPTVLP